MELQGKVIVALPERSGVSARGEWKSQDFVIETHEAYPKKMVFSVFGVERLERFRIQVGQEVLVAFDIDAHEYNGRWFNSVRAYDVRMIDPASLGIQSVPQPAATTEFGTTDQPTPQSPAVNEPQAPFPTTPAEESADDLPF